jgi:phage FluMu protein Com
MEKIHIHCEICLALLAVPQTAAGKKIRCPKCQGIVFGTVDNVRPVPQRNQDSPAAVGRSEKQIDDVLAMWTSDSKNAGSRRDQINCPMCAEWNPREARMCTNCNYDLTARDLPHRWCIECQQIFQSASTVDLCSACQAKRPLANQAVTSRATNHIGSQRSEEPIITPDGEKRKRCPMCAELIQYEAKICRFCRLDLTSGKAGAHVRTGPNAAPTSADDTYGYAIIAMLVLVLAVLWGWFPTLRLIDNPAGKLQIVMLSMWCGSGLLVYKDASNLGIEAKTNKSAALWALYAFLIPIVAIPHWMAYRQQLGGTRMFLVGLILSVVVAASIFHWSFAINNQVGEFQRRLQDLRNL